MHKQVTAATAREAVDELGREILAQAQIAFAAGCRFTVMVTDSGDVGERYSIGFDFTVLSPGEAARKGWLVYENHSGQVISRMAGQ